MARLISEEEQSRRAEAVRYAMATNALEGLQPSRQGKAIFERYVRGELSIEAMLEAVKATRPQTQADVADQR